MYQKDTNTQNNQRCTVLSFFSFFFIKKACQRTLTEHLVETRNVLQNWDPTGRNTKLMQVKGFCFHVGMSKKSDTKLTKKKNKKLVVMRTRLLLSFVSLTVGHAFVFLLFLFRLLVCLYNRKMNTSCAGYFRQKYKIKRNNCARL